ncbi:TPA: AmmeMemoRadiSam system radical SAM enzyme [Candidatus Delongbacteria bacterium]|nr:MAG: AmmeMemoRadiSam system radical SAM enzyme [Candidatus Delongbacteria bacterium GWF2_40_14]HAQ61254.1 AmmeMemoRadiSam system radical SAM enzyme [Candidatus Delongbacteria bacterium]
MEFFQSEYFRKTENGSIKCLLCERGCVLNNNQKGYCGANSNRDGELINLVYGHPVALNIDPIEKKPLYRFLKGTETYSLGTLGCNFKCSWCQNYNISQKHFDDRIPSETVLPDEVVSGAIQADCMSVSYTYNEPAIFYPYAKDIGLIAKENGLKNIFVTNGYQTEGIVCDMKNWVDAVNIDLKSFNREKHLKFTGGELDIVLRNLKAFADSPVHLEVTTLVIPDFNDSEEELSSIAEFILNQLGSDVPWHVSAFHPDYKMTDRNATASEKIFKAVETGKSKGLKYVYPGNIR